MDQNFDDFDELPETDEDVILVEDMPFPAMTNDDLLAELGYEDVGTLTGGNDTAVVAPRLRPSGPDTATRHYGDFALSATYGGIIELPQPIQNCLRISVHKDIADEAVRLIDAWRPHISLITQIRGYEQRMRGGVPTRFGALRIAPSSWGLAITVNRQYNKENTPMRLIPTGEPAELTTVGKPGYVLYSGHVLVEIAEKLGWAWLGRNKYPNGNPNNYPDPATFAWIRGWQ